MDEKTLNKILDRQFFYHEKSYDEVSKHPDWKSKYSLTRQQSQEWIEWGVNQIASSMKIDEKSAQIEMSWIEINYGANVIG